MSKQKREYQYREGCSHKVKANIVGVAFEEIRREQPLTPAAIVDYARPEGNPLHPLFNWDDADAAEKYRRRQANDLIVDIVVVENGPSGEPTERLAYVSVQFTEEKRSYVDTVEAMSSEEVEEQLTREAIAALEGWKRRYGWLKSLAKEVRTIDKILQRHLDLV